MHPQSSLINIDPAGGVDAALNRPPANDRKIGGETRQAPHYTLLRTAPHTKNKGLSTHQHSPPNAGVLLAPNAEPVLAPPKLNVEPAAGVDAAPKRPPPVDAALAPKPPKAGVPAGVVEPTPPPKGEGAAAPKAGAAGAEAVGGSGK